MHLFSMNGLSLFANIGVAEAYLEEENIKIKIANELLPERARFYQDVYKNTNMICGDITNEEVYKDIIAESKKQKINFVLATPPCQGMSTAGKQGNDERNYLIKYALDAILDLNPKYALIENVPQILKTKISVDGQSMLISDYIKKRISGNYRINYKVVSSLDYGVPQMRNRCIFLLSRKDMDYVWNFPEEKCKHVTLSEAIGNLPSLDPRIQGMSHEQLLKIFPDYDKKRAEGLKISKWHFPPTHKFRHVEVMMHTPEGCSALQNEVYYPKNPNGSKVRGFPNTYKRQSWDKPAYTITTYNGAVCSQDNVHPGRKYVVNGEILYSDPRVFSIYELLILMSLPTNWNIPEWAKESLIRHTIGEGIPPLVIKKIAHQLKEASYDKKD